jgi:hypothetical protein
MGPFASGFPSLLFVLHVPANLIPSRMDITVIFGEERKI